MDRVKPKPFIKWAGGKRQLIKDLLTHIPKQFNTYFEPFIGGGALFFETQPAKAYISDINPDLINVYQVIKNNVEDLIKDLKKYKYDEDYFYKVRNLDRTRSYESYTDVKRASRFIYLNKTCFNGLYRVNSKGYNNVPFGKYDNPKIIDAENLRLCSEALRNTAINTGSFLLIEHIAQAGDFVYFDPPYVPISKTSYFTSYSKDGFGKQEQEELRDLFNRLTKRGVYCMLSNSYVEEVLEMYKEYKDEIHTVSATRIINCKSENRGKIKEVIITNYNSVNDHTRYRKRKYA